MPKTCHKHRQEIIQIHAQRALTIATQRDIHIVAEPERQRDMPSTPKLRDQSIAEEFSQEEDLVFLCGHYEGIDERVLEMIVTDNVSIGDYVLTGGELPSMVMIDAISRLVPGVLNNDVSAEFESFNDNLLEYPQYTRPASFMEREVPPILLSGNHLKVEEWRRQQSILRTMERRPDLMEKAELTKQDIKFIKSLDK